MKIKIGTQMEEEVLRSLKIRAAQERLPMAVVLEAAVVRYLQDDPKENARRNSLRRLLRKRDPLPEAQFRQILEADYYDQ